MSAPIIDKTAFIAPNATVLGHVSIGAESSVFFGAVLRAEEDTLTIGQGTNIQDNCVLHVDKGFPMLLGHGCTVGHGAILHGCTVGDNTLVGMGAIILNGAMIGRDCIVGAGALVTQGAVIPDGSLVLGSPAKVKRLLTEDEIAQNRQSARGYVQESAAYKAQLAQTH